MKNLYTYKEIKDKIKSHDYNAEMLLMHLILRYEEVEKERDEARREAETTRAAVCFHLIDWPKFPWEKGSE